MLEQFMARVDKRPNGCWLWTGNARGGDSKLGTYGGFSFCGKAHYAHRLSYELFRGKIRKGLQLDHLCRNRKCVNPEHLEQVTPAINILRGVGSKTVCINGHPYTPENTYREPRSGANGNRFRRCRECHRIEANADYHANRDAIIARRKELHPGS